MNTAYNNCIQWIAGSAANRPHVTCHLLGLLPLKDRAQHLNSSFYLHLLSKDKNNPLQAMLDKNLWYPKTTHRIAVGNHHPLLFQFLNPRAVFTPHLPNLRQTSFPVLREKILQDLSLQKHNQIRSIHAKSPELLQIGTPGLLPDRIPGMDCDGVLTAPAADQARFLTWRRSVFGWGRKCVRVRPRASEASEGVGHGVPEARVKGMSGVEVVVA